MATSKRAAPKRPRKPPATKPKPKKYSGPSKAQLKEAYKKATPAQKKAILKKLQDSINIKEMKKAGKGNYA